MDTVVEIGLVCDSIERVHKRDVRSRDGRPIDAIAVGHYLGVRPQEAALALDRDISRALEGDGGGLSAPLLTEYSDRGVIRGELAQPFFLVDPRSGAARGQLPRLIAIAGMGPPSRFGTPELIVLARELCWALGRLRRRHLATVLIGTGNGNLGAAAGATAWIRGIKRAVTGASPDGRLSRVTFVVRNGRKLREVQDAIEGERQRLQGRAEIVYDPIPEEALRAYEEASIRGEIKSLERRLSSAEPLGDDEQPGLPAPTRLTIDVDGESYRFGAITARAAVPEREISVDPALIVDVNAQLAAASDTTDQRLLGRLLAGLLLPEEFREHLASSAALSLLLDARTAQLHWEMLVSPDAPPDEPAHSGSPGADFDERTFLGTSRGLTRQLRASFASPPQPPPPERRQLRVLIVSDPARDAPLPRANEEGQAVADLFHAFNDAYGEKGDRIEVHQLMGPDEATRSSVLALLMDRSFDVLHFVGHSIYQVRRRLVRSGWLFSNGTYLTASELNRLDRVPEFVFSNSCTSAAIEAMDPPRRAAERLRWMGSASTLAGAFLARGVGNFVGTAWPIDDGAGLEFARVFYSELLGLREQDGRMVKSERRTMSEAMRAARLALARTRGGRKVWGAYQHYGNPHSHLVSPTPGEEG